MAHIEETRQCYLKRDLEGYLAHFAQDYLSFSLDDPDFLEDKRKLREKIASEFERYDLLSMDFEVMGIYFTEEHGYAHLSYKSRLKPKNSRDANVLNDERENLIVARKVGEDRWLIEAKIISKGRSYYASP